MSSHYNVLMAREYTSKDGQEKSAFTKVGVAFPMKGKDGFQISLEAIPLQTISKTGKLECKLIMMLPLEDGDKQVKQDFKPKDLNIATGGDSIPF